MSHIIHKKGGDAYVGVVNGTPYKIQNWHGYGLVVGPGKQSLILDDIENRRQRVKQNMMVVVGPPGQGKSYYAIRLAEILDPKFKPKLQIVFERTHLLWLIGSNSPLKMGQAIIIDEAQFIAGARRWYEDIQKDVMEHIEAIRSRGFIIIIVVLHLNLLDKIIRRFVIDKMLKVTERGKATVYHIWTPTFTDRLFSKKLGKMALLLPGYEQCQYPICLICKFQDRCLVSRAIYERAKKEFLSKVSTQSQMKAALAERKKRIVDYKDLMEKVKDHKDEIVYGKKGTVDIESVKIILENHYGVILQDADANRIVRRGRIVHPDVFRP